VPTAASLFPAFSTSAPDPPIVFANVFKVGAIPPPLPSTPGQNPPAIIPSPVPTIPQLPWNPPPTQPPPVNTVRPTVTGTPEVGQILNSTVGTWTNATTYARQWLRNGSPIAGQSAAAYVLAAIDEGALIAINITATGPGGEASMDSLEVGPVDPAPGADQGPAREPPTLLPSRAAPAHRTTHRAPAKKKR
jgi:hypothetical protein